MKKITGLIAALVAAFALTSCTLYEDGSVVLDDGTGFCWIAEMGCGD